MKLAKSSFLCLLQFLNCFAVLASPLSTGDPYEAGVRYYNAKNYKDAARMFETAMRLNPAHSSALYYDALCYQHLGETERARALHHHVVNVFPASPAATLAQQALSKMGIAVAAASKATTPTAAAAPGTGAPPEIAAIDAELATAAKEASFNHNSLAERSFMEAEHRAERLGRGSPKLAQVLGAMGDYYAAKGEPEKACKAFKKELQVKERLLDRNSLELADCMSRHATAFINDNQAEEAERLLQRSVEIYQRSYESNERNHKNTKVDKDKWAGSLAQLATCYRKLGKFVEAKQLDAQVYNLNNAPQ